MKLSEAIPLLLENPFPTAPPVPAAERGPRQAAGRLLRFGPARIRGDFADAALALAVAEQECDDERRPAPSGFRRRFLERLPSQPGSAVSLSKGELGRCLALAAASARCQARLLQLCDNSAAMAQLRRRVWGACFGASLKHAFHLHALIRDHDILLLGETGTGKETVAHAIMDATVGKDATGPAPRSQINVAEVPESLIESELFGHVKGAYTGATQTRPGRIRGASGGCFFLDEVGDLSLQVQVKLLRVIETDEVNPVGSDQNHPAEVRYVAATHQNLPAMVEQGAFRQDLYQRLAGDVLHLPALRERPEDIPDIGLSLVTRYPVQDPDRERIETWLHSDHTQSQPWPGNVRQLHNVLRSMMLGLSPVEPQSSRPSGNVNANTELGACPPQIAAGSASLDQVRDWYLQKTLLATEGNYAETARRLGVDRTTVRRWVKEAETEKITSR